MLATELRKAEAVEVSPAMRLLERRREMQLVDAELEAQKRAYKEQDAALRRREEDLKAADLKFQDTLLRFTRFMQENDAKRAKAERKAAEERAGAAAHDEEAARVRAGIEEARATKAGRAAELEGLARCQDYLQRALEVDRSYQEAEAVLGRHATLAAANAALVAQRAKCELGAAAIEAETAEYEAEKRKELLALRAGLSAARAQLVEAQQAAEVLGAKRSAQLAAAGAAAAEHMQLLLAAASLYRRCSAHSKLARVQDMADPAVHLEVASQFVSDVSEAIKRSASASS